MRLGEIDVVPCLPFCRQPCGIDAVGEVQGLPGIAQLDGRCPGMQGHVGGTELGAEVVAVLAAGFAWTDNDGLVFVTKWGEPLYPDAVTALMTKLINAHNRSVTAPSRALPHARLNDLRHLHVTTLLLAGVQVQIVAARLGHADPAVTLRVYSHVLREHALGVGDTFAQAVSTAVSKSVSKPDQENRR